MATFFKPHAEGEADGATSAAKGAFDKFFFFFLHFTKTDKKHLEIQSAQGTTGLFG